MIDCNSLAAKCEVPIRFDNYRGCSHNCKYCFVHRYNDISKIEDLGCIDELKNFIAGKRNVNTNWCDWDIPLHWGGISDPFQKLERVKRSSYRCLEVFAETKYPFIVSTKGTVIADPDYLELLSQCNGVVQVSMLSSAYDKLEPGAPSFEQRLAMLPKLAVCAKRVNVRYQPYIRECLKDAIMNIRKLKDAGVHSIIVEGLVTQKKRKGMVFVGSAKYSYDPADLEKDFLLIRDECDRQGIGFECGDDNLRYLGDHTCCCGIDDLPGFKTNKYTAWNLAEGLDCKPTERMQQVGTARCFRIRSAENEKRLKQSSFHLETVRWFKKLTS